MKINLKVLQRELKEIADKHAQINSYFWGDFVRYYESKQVEHRTLIATFVRVPTASRTRTTVTLILTVADRCYRDFRNLDDVQSDAVEILNDIITIINRSARWRSFLTQEVSPSIDLFQERGGDMVAGAFASVNLNINNQSDICAIPIFNYNFDQSFASSCLPAIFLINGTQVKTIASGNVGEVKVVDLNGDETGTFDGTNWVVNGGSVCPDAEFRLINTAGTELQTGSIASGESADIVAPDSTFRLVNTAGTELQTGSIESDESKDIIAPDAEILVNGSADFPSIPSGGSENIMVENTQGATVGAFDGNSNSWVVADSSYEVKDQNDNTLASGAIVAEGSETINVIVPQILNNYYDVESGTVSIPLRAVKATEAGTITSVNAGGLTSLVIEVNGNPVTVPFTLATGDSLEFTYDVAVTDTEITFTGTYV
jgi:hypothetical protein